MNKSSIAIILLVILSLVGFGLYWSSHSEMNRAKSLNETRLVEANENSDKLSKEAEQLRAQNLANEQKAKAEAEARRMAEAQAQKSAEENARLVKELNQRLERAAEERMAAEKAQQELAAKMAKLAESQKMAQKRLEELQAAKSGNEVDPEAEEMLKQLQNQRDQLAQLESENSRLKERQDALLAQQMKTEEEIINAGGDITMKYPEMLSPNFRRKYAILFKERVAPKTGN